MRKRSSLALALANADRERPDLAEALSREEITRPLSRRVIEMLATESEPTVQVVLNFPEPPKPADLQLGDEEDPPKAG